MPTDPYRVKGPACVSFSGGRTSGFMLRQVLDAHGGTLPEDVVVCFSNTGLEHPKTYDFIAECGSRWNVPIVWLEYRALGGARHSFVRVEAATASRKGEPFDAIISMRTYLPNPVARYCTQQLKIHTMTRYLRSLGWEDWTNIVGLRADEPHRVARIKSNRERYDVDCPMHRAGHTLADVEAFWAAQPFDLGIPPHLGNCVGCFLKGREKIERIAREQPDQLAWWADAEERFVSSATGCGAAFRSDRPGYRLILKQVKEQPVLFPADCGDDLEACMCHD